MELHVDELYTYLQCPIKHKFKFIDKVKAKQDKNILFKQAIHKTVSYFFFAVSGGWIPTPKQMKDKWAKVWEETIGSEKTAMDIILSTSLGQIKAGRKPADQMLLNGMEMIHYFYHFNKDNPGTPIAVDLDFRVPIGGINLSGKFELIREIVDPGQKTRYIEIVDFKTGGDSVDPFQVSHDMNLTIASYAFRNLFQAKEDRMKYHYPKTGRDIMTFRETNDHKRLESIVSGVAHGIEKGLHYPRQSFMCKACEYKDVCNKAKF